MYIGTDETATVSSATPPPFACFRLCNPWIESADERGFIAPSPGVSLGKCVPKEIKVVTDDATAPTTFQEAQILENAASGTTTLEDGSDLTGLPSDEALLLSTTNGVGALRTALLECTKWFPGKYRLTTILALAQNLRLKLKKISW